MCRFRARSGAPSGKSVTLLDGRMRCLGERGNRIIPSRSAKNLRLPAEPASPSGCKVQIPCGNVLMTIFEAMPGRAVYPKVFSSTIY